MEKEFVPYELAVKLKTLGFDEPCIASYVKETKKFTTRGFADFYKEQQIFTPLYQQAFRWFREKFDVRHNIMDFIDDETGIDWDYEIATIGTDIDENGHYESLVDYSTDNENRKFNTYEEAELACLDKLIEIVETKSK